MNYNGICVYCQGKGEKEVIISPKIIINENNNQGQLEDIEYVSNQKTTEHCRMCFGTGKNVA